MNMFWISIILTAGSLLLSGCKPQPTKHVVMHGGKTVVFEVSDPSELEADFEREPTEFKALKVWAYYSSINNKTKADLWFARVEKLKLQAVAPSQQE